MFHRVLTSVTVAFSLGAILLFTPAPSLAIPSAGTYDFTSGLAGSFTSDGSMLTNWMITDPFGATWTPSTPSSSHIVNNNINVFHQELFVPAFFFDDLFIDWNAFLFISNNASNFLLEGVVSRSSEAFTFSQLPNSVPEPATGLLLLSGLALLAAYSVRQRRPTGVHVG